jgi:hypothetical protein
MPTPTYTALATVTLGSSASSVTFSSIPATYRDLILVMSATNTTNDITWSMRFNGDTGSNYNIVLARGGDIAGGVASNSAASDNAMFIAGWTFGQGTTNPTPITISIMDFSATDKHKTILNRFQTQRDNGNGETGMLAGRWANTSAITSLNVFPNSSTFATGSTISLYGVIA